MQFWDQTSRDMTIKVNQRNIEVHIQMGIQGIRCHARLRRIVDRIQGYSAALYWWWCFYHHNGPFHERTTKLSEYTRGIEIIVQHNNITEYCQALEWISCFCDNLSTYSCMRGR
jgi:hypothetical protein